MRWQLSRIQTNHGAECRWCNLRQKGGKVCKFLYKIVAQALAIIQWSWKQHQEIAIIFWKIWWLQTISWEVILHEEGRWPRKRISTTEIKDYLEDVGVQEIRFENTCQPTQQSKEVKNFICCIFRQIKWVKQQCSQMTSKLPNFWIIIKIL